MAISLSQSIALTPNQSVESGRILTPQAQQFLAKLHRRFNKKRLELLQLRSERQMEIDNGAFPKLLAETKDIRSDRSWQVAPIPPDLKQRWVEITGPTDRKMMINALNSGADVYMADFEDATSPTWNNMIEGQRNLAEAVQGTLEFTSPEGKAYTLNEKRAVLMVRPRGWHLSEKHMQIDGEHISGSLFDFGLAFFHNAKALVKKGSGPYFYLPKLESHLEARLWNDVFIFAQNELGIPQGSIRATVLIETIFAAFEMEEILYELREHSAGLNAGRWDYIFSIIKKFHKNPDLLFPDRAQITMAVPFMRAYAEWLVRTCHSRGAHAMGGMAAFVPNRKDPAINEAALTKVSEDKLRESSEGFDGTWVAHPDLVPIAHNIFAKALNQQPNQIKKKITGKTSPESLLNFHIPDTTITEAGMRQNINVSLQYLTFWLNGVGAAAIFNLMEDAATAEISRAQLWQWVNRPAAILNDKRRITKELYKQLAKEEMDKIAKLYREKPETLRKLPEAKKLLDHLVLSETFIEFLTLPAYDLLS